MVSLPETIYALSSGQLPSGIAIVRVSGPQALTALTTVAGKCPSPRSATRATLRNADGEPIDDALVVWFPAPRSATGEDVAEFHVHGGRAVVAALVATLDALEGLRPAEPGEFSRRAFENGKLDLVAAEALDDLIHADTERQRRQALRQLGGLLGDRARDWRQRIIDASALVEAGIDFAEEADIAGEALMPARDAIVALRADIDDVLAASGRSERLRDGLVVAIMGPPNAGKSMLLNAFAGREVAIVSPHAGTTRDLLEVHLALDGYPITLIDTAGVREAADPVEQEGIRRASQRASTADLILWLSDSGNPAVPSDLGPAPVWQVTTKADLLRDRTSVLDHLVSAKTGEGIAALAVALTAFAAVQFPAEAGLITRARHRQLLVTASESLAAALGESEPELVAEHLRQASHALGRLLGRVNVEDVLGAIFSRFCIGK